MVAPFDGLQCSCLLSVRTLRRRTVTQATLLPTMKVTTMKMKRRRQRRRRRRKRREEEQSSSTPNHCEPQKLTFAGYNSNAFWSQAMGPSPWMLIETVALTMSYPVYPGSVAPPKGHGSVARRRSVNKVGMPRTVHGIHLSNVGVWEGEGESRIPAFQPLHISE